MRKRDTGAHKPKTAKSSKGFAADDLIMHQETKAKGAYTVKKLGQQEYLYHITRVAGKQKWRLLGNVKDIDAKDPNLIKARAVTALPYARSVIERYLAGDIDKAKAKSELARVIDKCQ
ncbi:hypothetical protein NTE_00952 [Candidatus Nitrososphaera evergladensis SR1]|uniref:Uncharacterized protein n=1 Tax=Candidatus Nitrososphaera evergladensis SR1 TaxID=1459636 RepID=A0A075MQ71_9ARCH|nr:hypothetical protein [Candidatus Nitrososphaera evergladensis]AIF83027.1 hypothetical protein NTE_00952 [Candidatus Nitrososphaera evergladensis SR1]